MLVRFREGPRIWLRAFGDDHCAQFEQRRDGLWGVYRFKRGFGGRVVRSVGAWDRVYNAPLYWAYCQYVNRRDHGERGET